MIDNTKTYQKPALAHTIEQNNLFPVFIQLETLRVLIIGGGNVALEKLRSILQNALGSQITMVAIQFHAEIIELQQQYNNITIISTAYTPSFLQNQQLVFVAVNNIALASRIFHVCIRSVAL
jgi:siroheme synthase-like protein